MAAPAHTLPSRVERRSPKWSWGHFLLTTLGELLIIAGLFIGGYVAWQLWWTSVAVSSEVTTRIRTFQSDNPVPEVAGFPTERTDAPPPVPVPGHGEIFGVLHVPKWNWMQIPIGQGTTPDVLDSGDAGHYVDTQMPGEIGNFAIAGHRRTYGNNFRRVDILEVGDPLVVETADAYLIYTVTGKEIVLPEQYQVILPVPNEPGVEPTRRLMTMTTCHPEFGSSERYIVYSEMQYWTAKEEGKPAILADEPAR